MSEEMKELQTNEVTETMADYEDHFDDANPWNRVQDYMDKKTDLPVNITVETLQNYGAFVKLENGLSGLVHVSQISQKRVKMPSDVLTVGDEVEVKVIGIKDGKISLSMKALEEDKEKAEEKADKVVIPKAEDIGTNLGDLFKNIQL